MSSTEGAEDFTPYQMPDLQPASARELKLMIKDWRTGRATKKLGEALHDAYIAILGLVMVGAMIVNVIISAQQVVAQCASASCLSARAVLPWGSLALSVAVALTASRLFGPVLASAAEGFWLLDAPVDRRRLLTSRLVSALVIAFIGGAAVGALVAALTGSGLPAVLAWAAATGVSATAAVTFAAAEQGVERRLPVRLLAYLFAWVGVVALGGVIAVAANWLSIDLGPDRSTELALAVLAAGLLIFVISLVFAVARLRQIRRSRLTSGGALAGGISGAFFALDVGLVRDIVVEQRAVEIGHVKPKRGKGIGLQALTWREWQRLWRFPQPLLVVLATIAIPYAADALGLSRIAPVIGALALFAALIPLLGGLRVLTRTGGLARCLPYPTSKIKLATIAIPAGVALVWVLAITAAFVGFGEGSEQRSIFDAFLMALATGAAGLLGAVRWTQSKPVNFAAPMVATQAGAFPPGLTTKIIAGFDICVLVTFPMLLGGSPFWSIAIAGIVALFLLISVDADQLRQQQQEQQRMLDEQKKRREAAAAQQKQRKR
ncbi:DUF6297 family protein [Microlunatus parietis]|uniref:ABC-2 type transport system permease protein n=1 Tax=Microlunatus parietis TaxID=682979 RepID=A0A7Y9I7C6_9ACTN|nr:DUF6297 family protein [Microlunatus parietis]NYE71410.1 hypothetical protein [Microlunatus parietis]